MIVAFDLETEMIPARRTVLSKGGKPANITPYVTPRPVLGSVATTDEPGGVVVSMDTMYSLFKDWVVQGVPIIGHNVASFDLDVLYTYGTESVRRSVVAALDQGLIIDTKLLDWLVRLAAGIFDMPRYRPEDRKWFVPQSRVRSLKILALEYLNVELDKDPEVRCGYGQFLGRPLTDLPEKFRVYAEQDAWATLQVGEALLREADSIDPQGGDSAFGPLSCKLQARASFVAHQMDKQGVHVNQERAHELHTLFEQDEGPLEEALVRYGLGKYKPIPKAERSVEDIPLDVPELKEWRKV
jgi:hypothetical protein